MTRIFIAGAAGAVGRPLCRLLVADRHAVTGTTRSPDRAAELRALGIEPVVVDVFDAPALKRALAAAQPEVVIHQLTDLPPGLDPAKMAEAAGRNARLRDEGTRNLLDAAIAAGASRIVAQSIAFAYAPGPLPHREDWPLNLDPPGGSISVRGVASLERQVLGAPLESVILRYGRFYGPGTGFTRRDEGAPVHVDAAADAARCALTRGQGIYNVAEDDGTVAVGKAVAELGWDPSFRIGSSTAAAR
jgi:nucleoside-diphosphate-sugar epimerase